MDGTYECAESPGPAGISVSWFPVTSGGSGYLVGRDGDPDTYLLRSFSVLASAGSL